METFIMVGKILFALMAVVVFIKLGLKLIRSSQRRKERKENKE